jgi:hypothetical protein
VSFWQGFKKGKGINIMAGIDYIWEGPKAQPTVPYSPATGLDNANNIFYVSSKATKTVPGQLICQVIA